MKEQFNSVAVATTMTSLQIAEVTGKNHYHILRAIRSMEPAWEKVSGNKFSLTEYTDAKGERRPVYSLTKTECLYVATKFNDEARAKLVLRWEKLETENMNVSLVNEKHNILLAKGLEAAQNYSLNLKRELEWSEQRNKRLREKIFEMQNRPLTQEDLFVDVLAIGINECRDVMFDCVGIINSLHARVAMLEQKLGMYEPLSENLLDKKGGEI